MIAVGRLPVSNRCRLARAVRIDPDDGAVVAAGHPHRALPDRDRGRVAAHADRPRDRVRRRVDPRHVPSWRLTTHTAPSPNAIALGPLPTRIAGSTLPLRGSIRVTVPASSLATHSAPRAGGDRGRVRADGDRLRDPAAARDRSAGRARRPPTRPTRRPRHSASDARRVADLVRAARPCWHPGRPARRCRRRCRPPTASRRRTRAPQARRRPSIVTTSPRSRSMRETVPSRRVGDPDRSAAVGHRRRALADGDLLRDPPAVGVDQPDVVLVDARQACRARARG